MFQGDDGLAGAGGGAAALRLAPAMPRFGVAPHITPIRLRRRDRLVTDGWLVVDLGARIGSLTWFRGLITCGALCFAAGSFAPGFGPIIGFVPSGYTTAQQEEAAAQAIAPLAFGGDTGRRYAPTANVRFLADTPERPQITVDATLGRGDSLGHALTRAGVSEDEADRAVDLVADAVKPSEIVPGTVIGMTLGRRPNRQVARPLEELAFRARFDLKLAIKRVGNALTLIRQPIAVDDTPLRIEGRVGNGLYLAARAAGAPAKAVESYIKALNQTLPVGSVDADDRFDMIVAHRRAATGETETGELLYAGLHHDRREIGMMRWVRDGKAQWFDVNGVGQRHGGVHAPVDSTRITSRFGMRMHPLLGYSRMHKGIDIGAPYGAPIMAAIEGTVIFAGWHGGHGNYVLIKHDNDLMTGYAHMSRMIARRGAHVAAGQVIGYVGSTGLSTGPHLHWEVYRDRVAINPASLRYSSTDRLAGSELSKFKTALADLLAVYSGGGIHQAKAEIGKPAKKG